MIDLFICVFITRRKKSWIDLIGSSFAYKAKEDIGIDISLNDTKVMYNNILCLYEDKMKDISESSFTSFAPGKIEYMATAVTFYYKGTEVIYIFPWRRKNVTYIDTKYGYCFNNFYEYVKYRYAKEDFGK